MTTTTAAASPASALFASLNGATTAKKSESLDFAQNRFLTLLTTQLKNQDPLNPLDNAQITTQLAQISTVDGIERLNATLARLIDGQSEAQTYQAAGLVGHTVLVPGTELDLSSGIGAGGVELAGPADAVKIEIKDANGLVIRTLQLGSREAGVHAFGWDGKADSGAQAVDGRYKFTVTATQGGNTVSAERLQYGEVGSVARQAGEINVNVGRLGGFATAAIRQIL